MNRSVRVMDESGNSIPLIEGLVRATEQSVPPLLTQDLSRSAFVRAADILLTQTDRILDDVQRQRKPEIACKKGCFWCCHAYVSATALEVLYVAEYIRQHFTPDQQEAVKQRVADSTRRKQGLNWQQQEDLRLLCPLLVEGSCSVYPARPLACRGFSARSEVPCRHNYEHPEEPRQPVEFYRLFREITSSVRVGLQQGLDRTPFQNDDLELVAALRIALNTPDIVERWLSGERAFADASLEAK